MRKIFVESKIITAGDFDLCWRTVDLTTAASDVVEPFIHALAEKKIFPVDKSLKLLADKIAHGVFAAGKVRRGH